MLLQPLDDSGLNFLRDPLPFPHPGTFNLDPKLLLDIIRKWSDSFDSATALSASRLAIFPGPENWGAHRITTYSGLKTSYEHTAIIKNCVNHSSKTAAWSLDFNIVQTGMRSFES